MSVQIELTEEQTAVLSETAAARGISVQELVRQAALREIGRAAGIRPYITGYGMLAKYGPAPSAEEIDENRREMFRGFAEDY